MGRSTPSCFKIITCSGDAVEKDDLEAPESKSATDKRGWSFRKRSARHRVLSNSVISESPSSGNKESPESAIVNFQVLTTPSVAEKISTVQQRDDKSQLPISAGSKESETEVVKEDDSMAESNLDESVIIVIQSAFRGFLARRALLKLKSVVKLQAVVRGHLVRRHAVGTLRCVNAIIKMQALVRARRARLMLERSCVEEKVPKEHAKDGCSLHLLVKENSVSEPHPTYTSMENLLSNAFARQLLDSTTKTKHIHVRCDPSRSGSAWKWLERWMSVSSTSVEQSQKPEPNNDQQEEEKIELSTSQLEIGIPSENYNDTTQLKSVSGDVIVPSENEENLITYDATNFDFQACRSTLPPMTENQEKPQQENIGISNSKDKNSLDILADHVKHSDLISPTAIESHSESEQPKVSNKRAAPEQLETDGKKSVFGSRKASNPAFIAAQSKFEELTSVARSISLPNQDGVVESGTDASSVVDDTNNRTREIGLAGNSIVDTSVIQVVGSECGTELSISSTLDSPDESEVGGIEVEHEPKVVGEVTCDSNTIKCPDLEPKGEDSYSIMVQQERSNDKNVDDGELVNPISTTTTSEVKQNLEKNVSDMAIELDYGAGGHQANKLSPQASPRSYMTVPESQGTPSSQVSVNAKRTSTGDKSGSNPKRKSSSSTVKQSPSNTNNYSGARNSLEQLPKDLKSGKRRNSFGSSKSDHDNQEPRDSSSSNSLPSYMQATQSARAKTHANNSPRSSPDVQDKDIYIKKRHSLPGTNGRHESPRIQRSMSQAQQGGAKGNGSHSQERKWQR